MAELTQYGVSNNEPETEQTLPTRPPDATSSGSDATARSPPSGAVDSRSAKAI